MVKEGIQKAMQVWITIEERLTLTVKEMVIDLIKSSKWFERKTWDKVVRIEAKWRLLRGEDVSNK